MPARFSTQNDSDEDRANPQYEAARQLKQEEERKAQMGSEYVSAGLDQLEEYANNPAATPNTNFISTYTGKNNTKKQPFAQAMKLFFKKRGALVSILGILGIGGGLLAGFAGPSSMLVAAMENMSTHNDSSSTALERRFMKVLGYASNGDPVCAKSTKTIKCKMGKISNKALTQLKAKGVTPYFDADATNTDSKRGYPSKNPKGYTVEVDGTSRNVPSEDLISYLTKNPRVAAKVLGTGGAFNLKIQAWSGKYITQKFLDPFNIKRDGGLADGQKTDESKGKLAGALEKLQAKIPGADALKNGEATKLIQEKAGKQLDASKKGGTAYTLAVASCIAVKAPGYIAGGIAAVQLAQILPIANEVLLSPGSKIKASGVDKSANFTSEDMDTIGTLLTEKTKSSDGTTASALDSPILLAALGINSGKPAVSQKYTPGYAALTSPIVLASRNAEKKSEPACNALMSPAAMYTALAVDSAVTIAASSTIIGGIVKVAASLVITEIATTVTKQFITDKAEAVIAEAATNDAIPKAKGKDLGDVLGISGLAFFSSGGMAHGLPSLKQSQVKESMAIQQESENFQRQMDVASLSPFDTSSQYTFLGSIIHNFGTASIASGASNGGFFSRMLGYMKTPLTTITTSASAADFSDASCGYAASFGLNTEKPENTPAINAAGMPCTGLTDVQDSMSVDNAISLIEEAGWVDNDKLDSLPEGATIDDLVSKQYIKADTPMTDFIETCMDASTGDYLYNSAGCSIDATTKDVKESQTKLNENSGCADGACTSKGDNGYGSSSSPGVTNNPSPEQLAAISVFLLDFQDFQALNGNDDPEDAAATDTPSSTADATIDQDHIYDSSTSIACAAGTTDEGSAQGYVSGKEVDIKLCSIPNTVDNGPDGKGGPVRVNSRISGAALAMIDKYRESSANPSGSSVVRVADSFRSMAAQQQVYAQYGSGRAARPGYSNHQMGLAIDFQLDSNVGASRPGNPTYDWLVSNAKDYGFTQLSDESWHWQPIKAQGSKV